ncbi:hypothetical protein FACS189413_00560 [Bacteroidia bacterium]|nr:hypothetical protein FACS189463_2330 [Bacteroidia bacterium]GHU66839.1 hypothetical protein FACS189413_00560 [Bacteroidia bacterium]
MDRIHIFISSVQKVEKELVRKSFADKDELKTKEVLTHLSLIRGEKVTNPELPLLAVTEAIVNAICHRGYNSNGSVQVMLFKDRLEISNPGHLPADLTLEMLSGKHFSRPRNPLIATPMYLRGSIEQMGTGTKMIVEECEKLGLRQPNFDEYGVDFVTVFWRKEIKGNNEVTAPVTAPVNPFFGRRIYNAGIFQSQPSKATLLFNGKRGVFEIKCRI